MQPANRPRGWACFAAPLLALCPAGLLVAGNLDLPDFASVPGDPALAPLRALVHDGQCEEVEREARARLSRVQDPEDLGLPRAADLLEVVLDVHMACGGHPAEELRDEADAILQMRRKAFGPDDLRLIPILWRRGWIAYTSGEAPRLQLDRMEEALRIGLLRLGPDHADLADLYRAVGVSRNVAREPDEALAAFSRCIDLGERWKGPGDHAVVTCLGSSAASYTMKGDLQRSVEFRSEAVARLERGSDLSGFWSVMMINALATELLDAGRFTEARDLLRRWKSKLEQSEDPAHAQLGVFSALTAPLLLAMGEFAAARRSIETALPLLQNDRKADEAWAYLSLLHSQAELYERLGDWQAARLSSEKALDETRRRLPYSHSDTYVALISLGYVEVSLRHFDQARLILEEARDIAVSGPESLMGPVPVLALLSATYQALGRAEDASASRRDLLHRLEKGLRDNPPIVAQYLNWPVYQRGLTALSPEGIPLVEKSVELLGSMYGSDHVALGEMLEILANLRLRAGDAEGALRDALRVEEVGRAHLRSVSEIMEERLALNYTAVRPSGRDVLLTIASAHDDPTAGKQVWEALAQSRALVLDEMGMRHRAVTKSQDTATKEVATALRRARERYAAQQVLALAAEEPEGSSRVEPARHEVERLERELAAHGSAQPDTKSPKSHESRSFLEYLPAESTLVAYFRYHSAGGPEHAADTYLALVATNRDQQARAVPLGDAAAIDAEIAAWRAAAVAVPRGSARTRRSAEKAYRQTAAHLANRIWLPLGIDLEQTQMVFVVPDGQIHLVNIAALVGEDGAYLAEKRAAIHYLGSERDLVRPSDRRGSSPPGLLALGGPAFDALNRDSAPGEAYRGARASCDDPLELAFGPLPGARREVLEIGTLWKGTGGKVVTLTGEAASEGAVKTLAPGEGVLHFATHGVVWGADCPTKEEVARAGGKDGVSIPEENPLRLSFLALAGANRRGPNQSSEDGILTAEEIASLDLSGVQWAVLSACDTARGPVLAGEGVLGLRRAFAVAGAATTIMSLWPVEDDDARQWMVNLYKHRLAGTTTANAVHAAGLDILRSRRARGLDTHPAHWGAFVAAGDWR
jgi:CHAT domain-containing protein